MTTCLGKSCSFGLPRMPFVNCCLYVFSYFPFGFEGRIWDLIVSVLDHCLSFYILYTCMENDDSTSSPKGNDHSPESNVPTSSHFKQASK